MVFCYRVEYVKPVLDKEVDWLFFKCQEWPWPTANVVLSGLCRCSDISAKKFSQVAHYENYLRYEITDIS